MPASFRLWGLAALVFGAAAGTSNACASARHEPRPLVERPREAPPFDVLAAPLALRLEPATLRAGPSEVSCAVEESIGGAILRCVASRHDGR
jgi:hypothetical protein